MNTRYQILCAYAGPLFVVLLTPVFFGMGFMPPMAPTMTPTEVAAFYEEHRSMIRLGATLIMQLAMLGVLWTAAISMQLRRAEAGGAPILSTLNLLLGALGFMFFTFPPMFWTTAAYRPERDIDLIYLFNDHAWLALVMPVMSATLQALVIGLAIFSDPRPEPIYPRWVAYLNFWAAIIFLPASMAGFFKQGPFAWNGVFDFWVPLFVFSVWIFVMAIYTAKAARQADVDRATTV